MKPFVTLSKVRRHNIDKAKFIILVEALQMAHFYGAQRATAVIEYGELWSGICIHACLYAQIYRLDDLKITLCATTLHA